MSPRKEYILTDDSMSGRVELIVFDDKATLASSAAKFVLSGIQAHHGESRFRIALSGGRTPLLMYDALVSNSDSSALLNQKAEFFFSDERAVGPEDKDSNFGTARKGLFEPLAVSEGIIHRMKGEATDLQKEAVRYGQLIRKSWSKESTPSLNLILLGMGPDGHTASLFPDYDFNSDDDSLIVAPWVESKKSYRLSFSLSLINASAQVLFLVTGTDKADVLADILSPQSTFGKKSPTEMQSVTDRQSATDYPAGKVRAKSTLWMVDKNAASKLNLGNLKPVDA